MVRNADISESRNLFLLIRVEIFDQPTREFGTRSRTFGFARLMHGSQPSPRSPGWTGRGVLFPSWVAPGAAADPYRPSANLRGGALSVQVRETPTAGATVAVIPNLSSEPKYTGAQNEIANRAQYQW